MDITLSIIIPAWNEENTIPVLLNHLNTLKLPFKCELIIVAGGEDDTFELCKNIKFDNFYNILILNQKPRDFKSGALIKGINASKGKFITLIDADVIIGSNFAIEVIKALQNFDVVNCDYVPMIAKGFWYNYHTVIKLIWSKNPFKLDSLIGGATISVKKDVIREIGIQNFFTKKSTAAVDYYMGLTLKKNNKKIGFVKTTRIIMPRSNNLRDFLKDQFRWLTAYYSVHQKEKRVFIINFILGFTFCIFPPLTFLMNLIKLKDLVINRKLKIKYSITLYFVEYLKNCQNLLVIIKKLIKNLQPIGHFKGEDRYLT